MKLSVSKSAAFVDSPDKTLTLFLLYGPDAGLVRERGDALARKFVSDLSDPFAVAELGSETLAGDAARLADELAAIPMLGGFRLVRVRDAGDAMFTAVDQLLDAPPKGACAAILEAGDLDKRSKLRARIEDDSRSIAIPCYPEEGFALEKSVQAMLKTDGFIIEREALERLTALLPPDRIGIRHEVDKLITFALKSDPKRITLEDVEATLSDAAAETIDEAVWAAASVNLPRLDAALARLEVEDIQPVTLLRAMQRHLLRLYEVRAAMAGGASQEEAIRNLRPPVFFKREAQMREQARRWSLPALSEALRALVEAEARSKSTGFPAALLVSRALLGIGKYAGR